MGCLLLDLEDTKIVNVDELDRLAKSGNVAEILEQVGPRLADRYQMTPDEIERHIRLRGSIAKALTGYRLINGAGPVEFFSARESDLKVEPRRWMEYGIDIASTTVLDGDHQSIVRGKHAAQLGRAISERLLACAQHNSRQETAEMS